MSVKIATPRLSLSQLREVVAGRDATVARSLAISLLASYDFPDKEHDLASLLENEAESPHIRFLAATSLGKLRTPEALKVLIKNAQVDDERIRASVVKALGRTGDESALDAVLKVKNSKNRAVVSQARFAAALISHRLGLEGNDLPVPDEENFLAVPSAQAIAVELSQPGEREAALCWRSLAREPLGIKLDKDSMRQIRCRKSMRMILFNQDFTGPKAVKKLVRQKALLGIVAIKFEEDESYSTSLLLLTSPAQQASGFNILIHKTSGTLAFGGTALVIGSRAAFSIRAVARPGSMPIKIKGTFADGELEFKTALAAMVVHPPRHPVKGLRLGS